MREDGGKGVEAKERVGKVRSTPEQKIGYSLAIGYGCGKLGRESRRVHSRRQHDSTRRSRRVGVGRVNCIVHTQATVLFTQISKTRQHDITVTTDVCLIIWT